MPMRLPKAGQSIYVRSGDYRDSEGDLTFQVALVGRLFMDADKAPWVFLTGRSVLADGALSSGERTISARVSGIRILRSRMCGDLR